MTTHHAALRTAALASRRLAIPGDSSMTIEGTVPGDSSLRGSAETFAPNKNATLRARVCPWPRGQSAGFRSSSSAVRVGVVRGRGVHVPLPKGGPPPGRGGRRLLVSPARAPGAKNMPARMRATSSVARAGFSRPRARRGTNNRRPPRRAASQRLAAAAANVTSAAPVCCAFIATPSACVAHFVSVSSALPTRTTDPAAASRRTAPASFGFFSIASW